MRDPKVASRLNSSQLKLIVATLAIFLATTPLAMAATFKPGPFGSKSNLLSSENNPLKNSAQKPVPAEAASLGPGASVETKYNVRDLSAFNCADLRRAALKMSVHASNIANRNTTRTPEGGAYQRQELICKVAGAFCNIQKVADLKLELRPGHPDADPQGYVKLPNINPGVEFAGLNNAAVELRILASQGVCGAKSMELGQSIIVKYHTDFEVVNDTMTFSATGRLSSWSRTTKDGQAQSFAFNADGLPLGL